MFPETFTGVDIALYAGLIYTVIWAVRKGR